MTVGRFLNLALLFVIIHVLTPKAFARSVPCADLLAEPSRAMLEKLERVSRLSDEIWTEKHEFFQAELNQFRQAKDRATILSKVAKDLDREVFQLGLGANRDGTSRVGLHYNMHGGEPADFIRAGGIRATPGNVMRLQARASLEYASETLLAQIHADHSVFYYELAQGEMSAFLGRKFKVKHHFIVFDLEKAESQSSARRDFGLDGSALAFRNAGSDEFMGIPRDFYLLPPIPILSDQELNLRFSNQRSSLSRILNPFASLSRTEIQLLRSLQLIELLRAIE